MAQWYPKMAEYDVDGWNADPYIGREFHGVWGNFDVKISLDKEYMVAGSGYLENASEIGMGYHERKKPKTKKGKITWHLLLLWCMILHGPRIRITFMILILVLTSVTLHFFYKNDSDIISNWKKLQPDTAKMMRYFNKNIGPYPYKQYSVVQGGDGGMEYAMLTLITGEENMGPYLE